MMDFSNNFYNARQEVAAAKAHYRAVRSAVKEALECYLNNNPNGATAAQMAKMTGLDSRDVAFIMRYYAYSDIIVSKPYVLIDEKGEPDFNHKIIRCHRVKLYKISTEKD